MSDKHEALSALSAREQDPPAEKSGAGQTSAPEKRHAVRAGFQNRTKGEALFNHLAYTGVGYFGVTGFSVFTTWLLRDSKTLSPHYENFVKGAIERVANSRFKSLSSNVYSAMTIVGLFLGGTIVSVLPVKWLEDHKSRIVRKFDQRIYGRDAVENDPQLRQAHAEMEAVPRQTWSSVIMSRVVAFVLTFSVFGLMGSNKSPVARSTGHSIDSVSTQIGRGLDRTVHRGNPAVLKEIENAEAANQRFMANTHGPAIMRVDTKNNITKDNGADRMFTRIASYLSLDAFYTIFTSVGLYVSTRVFAPMFDSASKPKRQYPVPVSAVKHAPHPVAANDPRAVENDNDKPAAQVSNVAAGARLAEAAPELGHGA